MYLCFVDESGSPPNPGTRDRRKYFVIAGLIMHEAQWHGIASELKTVLGHKDFKVFGEIKWRYFGPVNEDADNSVAHLSQEKRTRLRDRIFEIITSRKSVRIVACVTDVAAAYKLDYVKTADDLYYYTYKAVSERFQYYLQDVSRTVGDKQFGVVVADHRSKAQDDVLRKHHSGLVGEQHPFTSSYKNYIETVFLTPSHHSVGIQLVDMVAGAIGRHFNTEDDYYAKRLYGSFRARPNGNIEGYGLARFPGS